MNIVIYYCALISFISFIMSEVNILFKYHTTRTQICVFDLTALSKLATKKLYGNLWKRDKGCSTYLVSHLLFSGI